MPGVALRPARPEDAPRLASRLGVRDARARLGLGDLCVVAEEAGHIVGCTWMTRRRIRAPHYRIPVVLEPDQGYVHGLTVLASHRRRGLGAALFRAVRLEARRRGVPRTMSHVQLANRPAMALQAAAGGVPRRTLLVVVVADRLGIVLDSHPVAPGEALVRPVWSAQRARLRRVRRALVRRVRFDLVHLPTGLADRWSPEPPPGFEVRRATAADLRAMRETFPPYMVRTFDHLLSGSTGEDGIRHGHRGIVAVREGVPVGCTWATSVPVSLRHLAIQVEPRPGEWYCYGLCILPEWKGIWALGRSLLGSSLRDAREAGMDLLSADVDLGNRFNRVVRRLGGIGIERTVRLVLLDRVSLTLSRRPLAEGGEPAGVRAPRAR